MEKKTDDTTKPSKTTDALTLDSLKGRQSVRATFRLSAQVINLLSVAAMQLGVKQKSLFDQLIEDRRILSQVAAQAGRQSTQRQDLIQKTFVLSRSALESLNHVSTERQLPRDRLVELSILRLFPIIHAEQKKQEMRGNLLAEINQYVGQCRAILDKTRCLLGQDDPVYEKLEALIVLGDRVVLEIGEIVEKGKCMSRITNG